jgi:hypothetical protein
MIATEKKTCKEKRFAWSPAFSKAIEENTFWKIILSLKRNCSRPSERIHKWAATLGIQDVANLMTLEANTRLQKAQKKLREIKSKAAEYPENHLLELLSIASEKRKDKKHEKRIKILLRAHRRQNAYRKLQFILKPAEKGGLSSILVPEGATPDDYPYEPNDVTAWRRIYDHEKIQDFVQKRNKTHFSQAHGTPFTIPPLSDLDWGAQGELAE